MTGGGLNKAATPSMAVTSTAAERDELEPIVFEEISEADADRLVVENQLAIAARRRERARVGRSRERRRRLAQSTAGESGRGDLVRSLFVGLCGGENDDREELPLF